MSLDLFKRQASSFIHERFKTARLVFSDVTPAELWTEEATNKDPCSPNAKTMTRIAEASFEIDDYWRIVDVLHNRLQSIEWKEWKQSYKSLVLLEFLLTHGPEEFAEEFKGDSHVIEELGALKHIDENGLNWGEIMQKKSKHILQLLKGGQTLKESRLKALKITREIQGFGGNSLPSPSSSSTSSPTLSFATSRTSSFSSNSTTSPTWSDLQEQIKFENLSATDEALKSHLGEGKENENNLPVTNVNIKGLHLWNCPTIEEDEYLLHRGDEEDEKPTSFLSEVCSKIVALSPRSAERAGFKKLPNKIEG